MLEVKNKKLKMFLKEIKEKSKKLWKFFILLFLVNFIIINWSDISWIFNYKVVYRGLSNFFETVETRKETKNSNYFDREDSIEIPKIGIEAPIIFAKNNSEKEFEKALKKGVLHYPQSGLPGEEGTTIILGHSAPPNWPKIDYDWIFNNLNELNTGDEIYIYFNQSRYIYRVTEEFFLNPGQDIPSVQGEARLDGQQGLTNSKYVLNLVSCWPPGKDQKRIAVRAELAN
ncbi:MAG: sortase [Candidatus Nealsonbacteria bacterium]